jgi:hypothetical protein
MVCPAESKLPRPVANYHSFFFAVDVIPRAQIDLEVHKSEIISLYLQGHSLEDVCQYLVDRGVKVGIRTLRSRLNQWIVSKTVKSDDTPELRLCNCCPVLPMRLQG